MTETPTTDTAGMQIIAEALQMIDGALGSFLHRELVSSGEVTNVLLDVRSKLCSQTEGNEIGKVAGKVAEQVNGSAVEALA